MNCPSARSIRASGPRSTVKRAPASFDAMAKSIMPSASPSSKCWRGWKLKPARLKVPLQHDVGRFVRAVRHRFIQNVRQGFQDVADISVQHRHALFQAGHLVAQRGRLGFQDSGVGPGALALADLLRQGIPPSLLQLQRGLAARRLASRRRAASATAGTRGAPSRHRTRPDRRVWHECRACLRPLQASVQPSGRRRWKFRRARSTAKRGRSA